MIRSKRTVPAGRPAGAVKPRNRAPFLITPAMLVIILWGVNQAQTVVVLLLISAFLAVIGRVPVLWMERKGVPPVVAVLIVMASMVALLLIAGVFVGAALNSFSNSLPSYQHRIHDMLMGLKPLLAGKGIDVTDEVLLDYVNPGALMNLTASLFTSLGSVLSNMLLILFTVAFTLLEAAGFPAKLLLVHDYPKESIATLAKFVSDIKRYMVIKTVINLVAAGLITLLLTVLGVDYAVMWGCLAFLLHFIPSVGSIVAAGPPVLLAYIQRGEGTALLTAAGYILIGMIVGNIVEPRIMGRRFGMSPLVVFLSLILWGSLLGIVGALLCVPLTMTLRIACEAGKDTHWIAVLLGPETAPAPIPSGGK